MGLRILITNNTLAGRAGTEMYVRDIAFRLQELGHEPVCFSLIHGAVAQELMEGGIRVISNLAHAQGPFDLIHAHHRYETSLAAMAFPETPILFICHGPSIKTWQETPAFFPNIVQYAAVNEACRDRLVAAGVPRDEIVLLPTFVDLRRFRERHLLPIAPRTALVFSNEAHEGSHVRVIRQACAAFGTAVEVAGSRSGRVADRPEHLLPLYDLVFAKGRAAAEAIAVGCAVVLADWFGAGPLVTRAQLDDLWQKNFGLEAMRSPLTVEHLVEQIRLYDPHDAARARERLRQVAPLEVYMPQLLAVYEEVRATPVPAFDPWDAGAAFIAEVIGDSKDVRGPLRGVEVTVQNLRDTEHALRTADHAHLYTEQVLRDQVHGLEQHAQALEHILQIERGKVSRLRAKDASQQKKAAQLRGKYERVKKDLEKLRQKRRPWWKRWLSS